MTLLLSRSHLAQVLNVASCVNDLAKFPGARPALRGVVCLHAEDSGELLAVLDSATITAWRTGLAAALGTDVLARPSAVIWTRLALSHSLPPTRAHGDVRPGTHVTSLGADEPGKAELSPGLLRSARVIVDDTRLALTSGALGTAGLSGSDTAGPLSEVLRGTVPGRISEDEITVYTPVGLPWQDLALAWAAYRQAFAAGVGHKFDFLS